jgi:hypothetical protein
MYKKEEKSMKKNENKEHGHEKRAVEKAEKNRE